MPRLRIGAALLLLALTLAPIGLSGAASAATARAAGRPAFTLHGAQFRVRDHRLTYMVTICTGVKSVLALRATFVPAKEKRGRGAITLTPGTTQYQDRGCWPAFVSTAIARSESKHCKPIDCPAVTGRRYRSTVIITIPHETKHAPRLQAVA
jgi:hypothetical protein